MDTNISKTNRNSFCLYLLIFILLKFLLILITNYNSFFSLHNPNAYWLSFFLNAFLYFLFGYYGAIFIKKEILLSKNNGISHIPNILTYIIVILPIIYYGSIRLLSFYPNEYDSLQPILLLSSGMATKILITSKTRKGDKNDF